MPSFHHKLWVKTKKTPYFKSASHVYDPIFRLGNIANGKLQPFINLNQSKHHCYTLSTACTLFKLASEVGPRTRRDEPPVHNMRWQIK